MRPRTAGPFPLDAAAAETHNRGAWQKDLVMTHAVPPEPHPGRGRTTSLVVQFCSTLTSIVLLVFFLIGIADGSVGSFNMSLWLALLAAAGLSLWAGHVLRRHGKFGWAISVLAITAVPGLLAAFFLAVVLITRQTWN